MHDTLCILSLVNYANFNVQARVEPTIIFYWSCDPQLYQFKF